MKILSLLFLLFIAAGCSDSNNTTTSTNGDGVTGTLVGTIARLFDYHAREMTNKSGVLVSCEGTSFSAVTDSNGNWAIHDLPSRTYVISFSKPGFYTWKDLGFPFTGGGIIRYRDSYLGSDDVELGELAKFTITLDAVTMPKGTYVDTLKKIIYSTGGVYGHTSSNTPDSAKIEMYTIVSKTPELTVENTSSYAFAYSYSYWQTLRYGHDTSISVSAGMYYNQFSSAGFVPGDKVYFRAYPILGRPKDIYDPLTNKSIQIGYSLNGSNVLSAIME